MSGFKNKKFHFIAAGGVGMSGLAAFLLEKGCIVSGSDISQSKYTDMLNKSGGRITIGQKAENIEPGMTVVVSSAISEDNPELRRARELNLDILHRSDMLALISEDYSDREGALFFGFSGTHGKTTTSGLCAYLLSKAGYGPSYSVGGFIPEINNNSAYNSDDIFIAELDESDGTIVKYSPDVNVINNLSFDHPDFYKNGMPDILKTFKTYTDNVKPEAKIIVNNDCEGIVEFIKMIPERNIITFGCENANYTAKYIEYDGFSSSFEIYHNDIFLSKIQLSVPGKHNVYNALAVFAALNETGYKPESMIEYFKSFTGMGRRFQAVAKFNGITVIDDYAHHPEEIKTTLEGLSTYKSGRTVAVFQPHRYTRLKGLWNDFGKAFDNVDKLIVLDIYAASEKPIEGITSERFASEINHKDCIYVGGDMNTAAEKIYPLLKSGDAVITLGAGTVTKIGGLLAQIDGASKE